MQTLVSRDGYDQIEHRFWKRTRKIMGIAFGTVMCLVSVLQQTPLFGFGLALSIGLAIGAVTGICFGWLWAWVIRRSAKKHFDRVYDGDPTAVGKIPRRRQYGYRIPCNLFVTNNVTIGGVLYIGRAGVKFVPHQRYRGEEPVELPPDGLVVWAVDWKPSWWGRTFVASGPRVLEIGSGDDRFRFALPDPDVLVPRIRDVLGQE